MLILLLPGNLLLLSYIKIEKPLFLTQNLVTMKKVKFKNRMEAIDWIADYAENEGQFEVLREQLHFNHIYEGSYFLNMEKKLGEVVTFDNSKKRS